MAHLYAAEQSFKVSNFNQSINQFIFRIDMFDEVIARVGVTTNLVHGPLELRTELFWQKFLNLKP